MHDSSPGSEQHEPPRAQRGRRRALVALALLAAAGVSLSVLGRSPAHALAWLAAERERAHAAVGHASVAAPVAFAAAYALAMLTMAVPAWPLTVAAGFLFGFPLGTACSLAAATAGASGLFVLARTGLRDVGAHLVPQALERRFQRDAFSAVVLLRVVPVVPFALVTLAAARFAAPFGTFVVATALGLIPSTLAYAALGDRFGRAAGDAPGALTADLLRPEAAVPFVVVAALALAPPLVRRLRGTPERAA